MAADPTPGVVPVILQTGSPDNSVIIIRGLLAGGQDIIFRSGATVVDLTLPQTGELVSDPAPTFTVTQLYIGSRARFTALDNGVKLEVMDDSGNWKTQIAWTEGTGIPIS